MNGSTAIEGCLGPPPTLGDCSAAGSVTTARLALLLPHDADEAHALPWQSLDQALLLAAVPDRSCGCVDATGQRRFRNDAPVPDCGDQIILADHPLAISDQVLQEIEDLRLEPHAADPTAQLAPVRIETKIFEQIAQCGVLGGRYRQLG